ncbi:RHS repeat-associated protein [Litorimonas taeanensis]|uniref:RHS repeat-associated protein n=1 Tax=Litorimonas taeanensis TaxID=568099 RepID=A0A420WLG7_9PROT|nr:RHS repeat-associated core domain-containing protein [Litorimonas taeanensis]RKQ71867.1 RHS repeat-associated protein [Litorimonas taeanensis]
MCALSITDQKGSITGRTNAAGTSLSVNSYSLYGQPDAANVGRFQYTGQVWLEEVGLKPLPGPFSSIFDSRDQKSWLRHTASKDYKARFYDPTIKRFLNADPIGYGDGLNMYSYVGGDPVNRRDPSGMTADDDDVDEVVVTGTRRRRVRLLFINPFEFWTGRDIITGGVLSIFSGGGAAGRAIQRAADKKLDNLCESLKESAISLNQVFDNVPHGVGYISDQIRAENPWLTLEFGASGGNGLHGGVDVGLFVHQTSGDYGVYIAPSGGIGGGAQVHATFIATPVQPTGLNGNINVTLGRVLQAGGGVKFGADEAGLTGRFEAGLAAGASISSTLAFALGKQCGNINDE